MDRKPEEELRDIVEVVAEEGAEDVEQQLPIISQSTASSLGSAFSLPTIKDL
ncbi:MAG: hypothetical protein GY696_26590, partial [Gammaproteobacteria bacterium]|nr:hypothetical protein [Gammaproteobacteria bacterium]